MWPYETPAREGFFWAKLVNPTQMPDGEDWASVTWEVVAVYDNNGEPGSGEEFMAAFPGVPRWQRLEDCKWGPEVIKPSELQDLY